jgi:hypothetical protein
MKASLWAATLSVAAIVWGPALGQVPPSNYHEQQMRDLNRSFELRQRDLQREQQRDFEVNRRGAAPRTQRMLGEPRPGCTVGSAGC